MFGTESLSAVATALQRRLTPKPRAAGLFVVIGAILALVHATHAVAHDKPLLATVVGVAVPLVLALAIVAVGYWILERDVSSLHAARLALWGMAGGIAMGSLISTIVIHQHLAGHLPADASFQLATGITGGVLGGSLVGLYDVTIQRRSDRIESLQRATAEFVAATSREDVCELAVHLAAEELDMPLAGAWLYDESTDALEPVAGTDEGRATFDEFPTFERGEALSWQVFEEGELRTFDDLRDHPDRYNETSAVRSEIVLPLGSHGVINIGSTEPGAFDAIDVTTARLLADASGAVLDRAEREQRLRAQQRELETQNDRLEEFASIVSHDLRNPLTVAQGYLEQVDDECDCESTAEVEAALDRMEALITDLLHLARAGTTIQQPERVRLASVATDAWGMIDADAAVLEIDCDEVLLEADRSRLRQLFENLFRNAAEHGSADREPTAGARVDAGGRMGTGSSGAGTELADSAVSIRVGTLEDDGGFFVEDDGPGIPPEDRDRVLSLGYTTSESGTGLGLATVQRIAAAHDWSVSIAEGTDGGARFEIRTES